MTGEVPQPEEVDYDKIDSEITPEQWRRGLRPAQGPDDRRTASRGGVSRPAIESEKSSEDPASPE